MKNTLFIILFFIIQSVFSQKSVNDYAYFIIPEQFSFQDQPDQHQLNSLAYFLFQKENVTVLKEFEKIPEELRMIDCGGLKLRVNKESSAFRTKLTFELLNCVNDVVFKSEQGSSLEKDYKKGFQESFRNAFESFKAINYAYVPKQAAEKVVKTNVSEVVSSEIKIVDNAFVFKNEANLKIQLAENNGSFIGSVVESPTINYTKGDLICKLFKTSLPNVYKVEWKDSYANFIHTIGYFDTEGNLKIDVTNSNGITVMEFKKSVGK